MCQPSHYVISNIFFRKKFLRKIKSGKTIETLLHYYFITPRITLVEHQWNNSGITVEHKWNKKYVNE